VENEKDRPQLLDTLGATLGELFGDGLNEATDPVKASVLAGLNGRRVRIAVEITMPLHVAFGVVNVDGTSAVRLFEIATPGASQSRSRRSLPDPPTQ